MIEHVFYLTKYNHSTPQTFEIHYLSVLIYEVLKAMINVHCKLRAAYTAIALAISATSTILIA